MNELTVEKVANYIKNGSNVNFNSKLPEEIIKEQKSSVLCNVMYSVIHENKELRSKYSNRNLKNEFVNTDVSKRQFINKKFTEELLSTDLQELLLSQNVIEQWEKYNMTVFENEL